MLVQDPPQVRPRRCELLARPSSNGTLRRLCWLPLLAVMMSAPVSSASAEGPKPESSLSPEIRQEMTQVQAEIDRIEAATLARLAKPPNNQVQQLELLGKAMLYDKNLSVNRNEACAFCHMPESGFTGPISAINAKFGAYPGSVRTRFSNRVPQTHAYAALAPVLHYNPGQGNLVGGNF